MMSSASPGVRLSVVIAAWNGARALERCLRSLKADGQEPGTEVIVVTNFDATEMLKTQFPDVKHTSMPADTTVPVLRTTGICQSVGEIVALTEDHCTFGNGWCSEIKKAHQSPYSVIGGAVENASDQSTLDWAVYFCDYGRFMQPIAAAVGESLPGINVSFKRSVLQEVEMSLREGFFEAFIKAELAKRGYTLHLAPSIVVYHCKHYKVEQAVSQFYHLARGFAAQRTFKAAPPKRGAFLIGCFALPALLLGRIVVRTVRKRRRMKELVRSLPYQLLLTTGWSWGEFCGYLAGEGGSTGKWK